MQSASEAQTKRNSCSSLYIPMTLQLITPGFFDMGACEFMGLAECFGAPDRYQYCRGSVPQLQFLHSPEMVILCLVCKSLASSRLVNTNMIKLFAMNVNVACYFRFKSVFCAKMLLCIEFPAVRKHAYLCRLALNLILLLLLLLLLNPISLSFSVFFYQV